MPRFLVDIKTQVRINDNDKPETAKALLNFIINSQGTPDNIFILDFEEPEKTSIKNVYYVRIPADIKVEDEFIESLMVKELNAIWKHPRIWILGVEVLGGIHE
jgi:hypothetical protein